MNCDDDSLTAGYVTAISSKKHRINHSVEELSSFVLINAVSTTQETTRIFPEQFFKTIISEKQQNPKRKSNNSNEIEIQDLTKPSQLQNLRNYELSGDSCYL